MDYSPWSEREIWPFLSVAISPKPERSRPPKLVQMHNSSIHTCMNFLGRFRSIKFFDDHGPKGKFGCFEGKQKRSNIVNSKEQKGEAMSNLSLCIIFLDLKIHFPPITKGFSYASSLSLSSLSLSSSYFVCIPSSFWVLTLSVANVFLLSVAFFSFDCFFLNLKNTKNEF